MFSFNEPHGPMDLCQESRHYATDLSVNFINQRALFPIYGPDMQSVQQAIAAQIMLPECFALQIDDPGLISSIPLSQSSTPPVIAPQDLH